MNALKRSLKILLRWSMLGPTETLKRLEGVQGPERHLVGDVAERMPRQDVVEVSKTGRRAVGEIGGADELLRHIDCRLFEVSRQKSDADLAKQELWSCYRLGQYDELINLREIIEHIAEKRSDLSNSELNPQ